MDLAQQREQLREVLAAFGGTQERFDDIELDKLWNSGYRSLEALQEATREGLKEAGLLSANADHILRKGAAAGLGPGSTTGAGSLPAATVSGGLGVRQTAGVAAGQSLGGTADAGYLVDLFPSALYCMTFTLYDGVDVAMRLVSHAKANGFRGEVRHVSTSCSNFTLLLDTGDEASKQTLKRFAKWLATQVPVRAPGVETSTAFAKAAEADAARVEVTSDPSNPLTRDRELLDMYNQGPLTVCATTEVRLALEEATTAAEQGERLSKSSLGKSRASLSYAE